MQLTESNFQQVLSEESMRKTVFLYFYAPGPECDPVTRAVKKAVPDNNAYITLVTADLAEPITQSLAMQMGLRGVPALVVFNGGQPVEALQGQEITAKLAEIVTKYQPRESELKLQAAVKAEAAGKLDEALRQVNDALKLDPQSREIKFVCARLNIKAKNLERARQLLADPGREEQNLQEYKDLLSALKLAEQAQESPAIRELEKKHRQHPEDRDLTRQLAAALAAAGKRREALELLYEILRVDLGAAGVKQTFLDILSTMPGDPLQKEYRGRLYTLLH